MKINTFAPVIPIGTALRSKRNEGDGGAANQQYDPNQSKKDKEANKERPPAKEVDPTQVCDAVASFQSDATTQANGLSAVVEGSGPGLKVALKDVNGTILRHFSGEEFLLLRAAGTATGSKDASPRGKILDQKV